MCLVLLFRFNNASNDDDEDEHEDDGFLDRNDLCEPVAYKGGVLTTKQRNMIYEDHSLPGIGRKVLLTEEQKKERKVLLLLFLNIYNVTQIICKCSGNFSVERPAEKEKA